MRHLLVLSILAAQSLLGVEQNTVPSPAPADVAPATVARARAEVDAFGAGPRFDRIVGPLRIDVAAERFPSGRPLENQAVYSSYDHALLFARRDRFPSAGDPSIVAHEYGHAVWHALAGAEPAKPVPADQAAVYEGWADAFAAFVLDDPVIGSRWLPANGDAPRNADNALALGSGGGESHLAGQVYAGLLWRVTRGLPREQARALVLGSVERAPRPTDGPALVAGLVEADRVYLGGARRAEILAEATRRGIGWKLSAAPAPAGRPTPPGRSSRKK